MTYSFETDFEIYFPGCHKIINQIVSILNLLKFTILAEIELLHNSPIFDEYQTQSA